MGGVSGWAKTILFFLILSPACASIIACTQDHCSKISNTTFLQLDQDKGSESISFQYPFGCELLNLHPLGVFSWTLSDRFGCPDIRIRETLKLLSGMAIREDFETFARSCKPVQLKVEFDEDGLDVDFPELQSRLSDLDTSLSYIDQKDAALASAMKRLQEFESSGVSSCVSFIESFAQGLLKEGKKAAMIRVNAWAKQQEGDT